MKYSLNTTFDQLAFAGRPGQRRRHRARDGHLAKTDSTAARPGRTATGRRRSASASATTRSPRRPGRRLRHAANGGMRNDAVLRAEGDRVGRRRSSTRTRPRRSRRSTSGSPTTSRSPSSRSPVSHGSRWPAAAQSAAKTGTEGIFNDRRTTATPGRSATPRRSAPRCGSAAATRPSRSSTPTAAEYGRDLPGQTWKLFMDTYLAGQPQPADGRPSS